MLKKLFLMNYYSNYTMLIYNKEDTAVESLVVKGVKFKWCQQ